MVKRTFKLMIIAMVAVFMAACNKYDGGNSETFMQDMKALVGEYPVIEGSYYVEMTVPKEIPDDYVLNVRYNGSGFLVSFSNGQRNLISPFSLPYSDIKQAKTGYKYVAKNFFYDIEITIYGENILWHISSYDIDLYAGDEINLDAESTMLKSGEDINQLIADIDEAYYNESSQHIENILFLTQQTDNNSPEDGYEFSIDGYFKAYGELDKATKTLYIKTAANKFIANEDCSYMFYELTELVTISFGEHFDTSNTTDMSNMFCSDDDYMDLENIDLEHLNTGSVINMEAMFGGCDEFTELDLRTFDTSSVQNMSRMFEYCDALVSIDLSSFNTSAVEDMSKMFYECEVLESLNLSNFVTSSVISMSRMFDDCYSLESLDLSSFNTSAVEDMSGMFGDCDSLVSLDLSSFDTSSVDDMSSMFDDCNGLSEITFGENFVLSDSPYIEDMFLDMPETGVTIKTHGKDLWTPFKTDGSAKDAWIWIDLDE